MLWQSHAFKEFQEIQDATKLPFNDSPDRTKGGGAASTFLAMETKRNAKLLKAKSVSALDYKYEKMYTWLDFEKALGPYILGNSYRTANDTKMLIEKQFSISGTNNGTQVAQKSSDNEAKLFKMHWPSPAQWYQLNQLRIHAGTPERSMEGISKLLHYYCQLVHLEKKFPFDTAMNVSFMWFESFHHGRHSRSTCIQYEKACTVYNIAAIYAQLGVLEQPWTEKGKKTAAAYFQNAAGILVFLRDSICPRFKFKVSHESDLNELNLTALTTIMLAQAAECFYDKANDEKNSSHLTSIVAIYTSDLYDMAYRLGKALPSEWQEYMKTKSNLFGAIAHFHTGPINSNERVLSERLTRLTLAKEMIETSLRHANRFGGILQDIVQKYSSTIANAIVCLNEANEDILHQTPYDQRLLSPLQRPPQALVSPSDVQKLINVQHADLLEGVIAPSQFEDIRKLMSQSKKMAETYAKSILEIQGCLHEKLAAISIPVGITAANIHGQIVEVTSGIEAYQNDEKTLPISDIFKCLSKITNIMSSNLDDAAKIMSNVRDEHFNASLMNGIYRDLRARSKFQFSLIPEIQNRYDADVGPISPMDWTREKLGSILPALLQSPENLANNIIAQTSRLEEIAKIVASAKHRQQVLDKEAELKLAQLRNLESEEWTRSQGLFFQKAVAERQKYLQQLDSELVAFCSNISDEKSTVDGVLAKLLVSSQFFDHIKGQQDIAKQFSKDVQKLSSCRIYLLEQLQLFLVFREVSARFLSSCLKHDHFGIQPADPMIGKIKSVEIRWKELDINALEKKTKSFSSFDILKLLTDAYILPIGNALSPSREFWGRLHKKVSGSLIGDNFIIEDGIPKAEQVSQLPGTFAAPVHVNNATIIESDSTTGFKKIAANFSKGLNSLVPKRLGGFVATSRISSSNNTQDDLTNDALKLNSRNTDDNYITAVMKENAKLRGMVMQARLESKAQIDYSDPPNNINTKQSNSRKLSGRSLNSKSSQLQDWIAEQQRNERIDNKGRRHSHAESATASETERNIENTAVIAAAVAVGLRAAQKVAFADRIPRAHEQPSVYPSLAQSNTRVERAIIPSMEKEFFLRKDSGIASTSRQNSYGGRRDIYIGDFESKANIIANIKFENDSLAKELSHSPRQY